MLIVHEMESFLVLAVHKMESFLVFAVHKMENYGTNIDRTFT